MPMAGKGMLITAMDVDPADEADFNLWYDREHIVERVAIEGFLEARRWIAADAQPKYFATYSTATFAALSSPAYRRALANQTEWSRRNLARARNMIRAVGRITISHGRGRGGALAVVRLRPAAAERDAVREHLREKLDPGMLAGIVSMHLVESDPALSTSLTDPAAANPGAADWFVLVDGTSVPAVTKLSQARFANTGAALVSSGTYALMWDLERADL